MSSSLVNQLKNLQIVPVIVVEHADEALALGEILLAENLPMAEITFRSKAAQDAVKALKAAYPTLCVGAGTILNAAQATMAKEANADFIVSPGFNLNTVRAAKDLALPIIPGINNPMGVEMALEEGLTLLKLFPAEASGGINMIKSLLAPYQDIMLMPTGGINAHNVQDYLAIDRVIACGLSWMVEPKLIANQDWTEVAARIRQLKALVQQ